MKHCVLAIDQSTKATKGFLVGPSGCSMGRATHPHPQVYPRPGYVEHDPQALIQTVRQTLLTLLSGGDSPGQFFESCTGTWNVPGIDPVCISLSNQRETILAWDARTGEPFCNALVWQDDRAAEICGLLESGAASVGLQQKTGLNLDPYYSAGKLSWIVRNIPAAATALQSGRLMAGTVDTWLLWNLTGRKVFATDWSNASRTMLFNLHTLAWDEDLLELFGLRGILLPEPRSSDADFGCLDVEGLPRGIPFRGVMGDSHAALFGHGGRNPGDAKASYGTGSSIMRCIGQRVADPPQGMVQSVGWGLHGIPSYVHEGNIHSTGFTISWLIDNLKLVSSVAEAESFASSTPDSAGVYLVPAFSGLGAPYWEHGIRAIMTGLSHGSTRDHVVRAAMESIAFQVMDLIHAMNADGGSALSRIHVDGGPSRNSDLMQFQADILGIPVVAPAFDELSALGSAYMGGEALGLWTPEETRAAVANAARVFVPRMDACIRKVKIDGWKNAIVQALAGKKSS